MHPPQMQDSPRPTLSESEVSRVLLEEYGFRVTAQSTLGGEIDQNVWVRTDRADEFLLKVTSGQIDEGLRWQQAVLDHIESSAPDIPAPRVVPSRSGAALVPLDLGERSFVVRLLTWLPGKMFAEIGQPPAYLLADLGRLAARLTQALGSLPGALPGHTHHWDVRRSGEAVDGALPFVQDEDDRRAVTTLMTAFDRALPLLDCLPSGVIHQDLNDFNVLAAPDGRGRLAISGVLDFNDSLVTVRVAELAVAVAYAMLRQDDPLEAAAAVVEGFHSVVPLTEAEISVVFPLAAARLCVNATTWMRRTTEFHHPYGHERMRHTWPTLRQVATISPVLAEDRFRIACGLGRPRFDPQEQTTMTPVQSRPAFSAELPLRELDLGPDGDFFDDLSWDEPQQVVAGLDEVLGTGRGSRGYTRHLAPSMLYAARREPGAADAPTVQIGVILLARVGEVVQSILDGEVVRADVGGPLVLRHRRGAASGGENFWTCWWGVDPVVPVGSDVAGGDRLGLVVPPPDDRGLGPAVQVQVLLAEGLVAAPPPLRVRPAEVEDWARVTADPGPVLGLPARSGRHLDAEAVVALRDERLARSQRAYYRRPPKFVRGRGVWLYDEYGRGYLDSLNNVTHVGHAEPRISAAAARQWKKLNTNSRFLYEGIATYAERLVATLPPPLEVVFLVCTGSEANDLALRMARQVTGRADAMVIDGAYHGNTAAVMGISPNRYKGPGGRGAPPTTHEVPRPDVYRGEFGSGDPDAGRRYADQVQAVARQLVAEGRPPGVFIAESLMGTAGNIVFPDGYLAGAFTAAREAGALCISDEVQVGVGRLGSHFWGFEVQGVVPDIVTMGKPLGNGHPMAAVVTTREIADAFDDGVKYFNTFGGNPVSCAIGTTVLDIVQQDGLQAHAASVGKYFLTQLEELGSRHQLIGDVRGKGLYLGIELVRDRDTKEPATPEALRISELMKDRGVVVYPTGVLDNVLKLKPPMVFDREHVDLFVATLDGVLAAHADGGGPG
jgi:4-aminobutyrate aminotransferase-like enzyme/Ser/Thr protein kinase RdoA (MazF antagonist)